MDYTISSEALAARLGDFRPEVGLVLGSGLGFFADERISNAIRVPYGELPGFPESTVRGHAGQFVAGEVGTTKVLCMQGRLHYYEGYGLDEITLPIRLMARLGVKDILLTNAAGGIRPDLRPGDIMVIDDHINFLGNNPLRGPNLDFFGLRFPDMTEVYCRSGRDLIDAVGREQGLTIKHGVYVATIGPSFETPAEIRAFRALGADAVGMSTVPECVVARHCGMRVLAISCISNCAAGLNEKPLTFEEVAEAVGGVRRPLADLVEEVVKRLKE